MRPERDDRAGEGALPSLREVQTRIRNYFISNEFAPPDTEVLEKLGLHLRELYRWNRRINLTAIRDIEQGIRRHVAESWEGVPIAREFLANEKSLIVDLGSGNGFPALPLLFAFPHSRGVLVESTGRKSDFLRSVILKTGIADRVRVLQKRVRDLGDLPAEGEIITLRAFPNPADWIPRLLPSTSRRGVLAWLSRFDAEALASELQRQGASASIFPLRSHSTGAILAAR